jgi:hypothetical protein
MFCLKGASFARLYRSKVLSDKKVAGADGELHPIRSHLIEVGQRFNHKHKGVFVDTV